MPRIDTKSSRQGLQARREPHWMCLGRGFYLGFRRTQTGSETWVARCWFAGKYQYQSLGSSQDFDAAKQCAESWREAVCKGVTGRCPTVAEACCDYVSSLSRSRPRTASDAEGRFRRLIYGTSLGATRLDQLQPNHVRHWLEEQISRDDINESHRRARASANRNLGSLKAALNLAYSDQRVGSNHAWSIVKPFSGCNVGRGNEAYVDKDLRRKYVSLAPPDLASLILACLHTGARPGELAALEARDYNRILKTLTFRESKQMRQREVPLSDSASKFFDDVAREVIGTAKLIRCADGSPWTKDKWKVSLRRTVKEHGLKPIKLYDLRHTAISDMLMVGIDSFAVAQYTGTSVRMIEKTYGHLKQESLRQSLLRVAVV